MIENLASGQTYSTTSRFDYASYERLGTKIQLQPTYNCTNMSDAFSVNNASAKLDYPVGLMSIDELSYAGGEVETTFRLHLMHGIILMQMEKVVTGIAPSWALSPGRWNGSDSSVWGVGGSA